MPLVAGITDIAKRAGLINRLQRLGLAEESVAVLRATRLDGLSDQDLVALAGAAAGSEPEEGVMRYYARIKDPLVAAKGRFDYYNARSHKNPPFMEKALAEVATLEKSPKHAGADLSWTKANLLRGLGRYEEAIKVYRQVNRQPDSTFEIAKCLVALKMYPEAVKTVSELEAVGGGVAARAALEVADIYRAAGEKGSEVRQLRLVLKRYPKSGQSSEAHNRLEAYGVPLVGGESEADD
jgi:tetratricopeptide (TPR) repeat protein